MINCIIKCRHIVVDVTGTDGRVHLQAFEEGWFSAVNKNLEFIVIN